MKIKLLAIGKTDQKNVQDLLDIFQKRLKHYVSFEIEIIPDPKKSKKLSLEEQKSLEGLQILKKIASSDTLILLDERGREFRSIEFASFLQKKMNAGTRQLVFAIGGPYGFSKDVYDRSKERISFSKMTFSHQMIRLFVIEQVYRAFTILKNEPYHHE